MTRTIIITLFRVGGHVHPSFPPWIRPYLGLNELKQIPLVYSASHYFCEFWILWVVTLFSSIQHSARSASEKLLKLKTRHFQRFFQRQKRENNSRYTLTLLTFTSIVGLCEKMQLREVTASNATWVVSTKLASLSRAMRTIVGCKRRRERDESYTSPNDAICIMCVRTAYYLLHAPPTVDVGSTEAWYE